MEEDSPRDSGTSRFSIAALLLIPALAVIAFVAILPLSWRDQAMLGLILVGAAFLVNRLSASRMTTLVLILLSCFCTIRYAFYRYSETVWNLRTTWWTVQPLDIFFVLLLLAAETYAVMILILGHFQTIRPLRRRPIQLPGDDTTWPTIDVFIPTYNEPLEIVKPTVLAALNLDWPADRYRVSILDDGRRREFEEFAESCGADYIARLDNAHAKAGNINHAMRQTTGEYIAIFDCDHIPTRSFLQMTTGWFLADAKLAMLQTPHHYYSPDPFEKNLGIFRRVPNEGALFYGIIQDGNDLWNATFFCGSCAVLRRTALEEIGGVAVETVTEDAHTALRMHSRGWNTAYINIPQAGGLATSRLSDHVGQRIRWARGMIQILRVDNPLFIRGLKLPQRLCYFNAALHFLFAAPRLIFLTSPLVYLLLGHYNVFGYLPTILAYAFPHLLVSATSNSRVQGRHRHSFWNEIYEIVLAPYILMPTLLALVNPKWGKFNVTAKASVVEGSYFDWRIARPFLVLLFLNALGAIAGVRQYAAQGDNNGVLIINLVWACVNVLLLGAAIAVAYERQQRRTYVRINAKLPVRLVLPSGEEVMGRTLNLSSGGLSARFMRAGVLARGEVASVIVALWDGDAEFPVQAVESRGADLRFEFQELSLPQYAALTRAVFSRADTWLDWSKSYEKDRPLRSLLSILGIAFSGLFILVRAPFQRHKTTPPAPLQKKQHVTVPLVLLCLGLLMAGQARGAAQSAAAQAPEAAAATKGAGRPTPGSPAAASTFHDVRDLGALGYRRSIPLQGSSSRANIYFSVPLAKLVDSASLDLQYHLSPTLVAGPSRINILLNGAPIASLPVAGSPDSANSLLRTEVPVTPEFFQPENTLAFELVGSCGAGCDEQDEGGVWASIEPSTELRTAGTYLLLPNRISVLPSPFLDNSAHRVIELPFVLDEHPSATTLEAASITASWFGIKADYRGIHFPVTLRQIPVGNVVAVGTGKSELMARLGIEISGPTIAVRENPADPYGKVLVISGEDEQQVLTAARAFALGAYRGDGERGVLSAFSMPPERKPYDAPKWLQTDREVRLTSGVSESDLHVTGSGVVNLYFRLAPDLYYGAREMVPLRLLFSHSKLVSAGKAEVRVSLNGTFIAVRRIHHDSPADVQQELLELPAAVLYARNTLSVEFYFEHVRLPAGSPPLPRAAILRDTELLIRGISHFTEMPRLEYFSSTGFPFTRTADLADTAIVMPADPDPQEISLLLTIMGFLCAQTGYPGIRVTLLNGQRPAPGLDKDILMLGTYENLPLLTEWDSRMLVHPEAERLRAGDSLGLTWISERIPFTASAKEFEGLSLLLQNSPQIDGVIQGIRSPLHNQRSVIAIAALTNQTVRDLANQCADPSNAYEVAGSLSILYGGHFHSYHMKRHPYHLGGLGWWPALQYWSRQFYWLSPVLVFLWIGIVAVLLNRWLEGKAAARLELQQ